MPTAEPLIRALFLIVAMVLAGLVHSAWLGSRWSRGLRIPLDGGARIRGRRVFGDNKTVRGFVVMVPAASVSFLVSWMAVSTLAPGAASSLWPLSSSGFAILGALAGLGFMLGELPNSFVKRQLDIAPGSAPHGRLAASAAFVVDRLDSIVGMLIAVSLAAPTPWMTWVYVIVIGPAIHFIFSILLYRLGVKERVA
ncbi:MAG TPA: CDP-archaeol synthase [Gemmatimonadaceae bacterium]|nr:CDP-archaeol synthase [Gemmatimonadaceae bacterium]